MPLARKVEVEKPGALPRSEAEERMRSLRGWSLGERSITREFVFGDFREAMAFVNQVAEAAEAADHHPEIAISYNHVKLELSTHKSGGLTEKDFELARAIDGFSS